MKLKIFSPAAPGEAEETYRMYLVSDDGVVAGCPHVHQTLEDARDCPEARVTLGDIAGLPLPDLTD